VLRETPPQAKPHRPGTIDLAPNQRFQILAQRLEPEQPNLYAGVKLNHDVDIAAGPHFLDAVMPADIRQPVLVDLSVTEL